MTGQVIEPSLLSVRLIANVNQELYRKLNLKGSARSLGLVTADSDDVLYTALDAATKDAQVEVVYAKSMYAGAANASTKYAGDAIGTVSYTHLGKNDACFSRQHDKVFCLFFDVWHISHHIESF